MADLEIKKILIKQNDLPAINVNEEGYVLKYRIVSEDKNRTSQWSPISTIQPEYTYLAGNISFNKSGQVATFAWDSVSIQIDGSEIKKSHEFDIWLKWDRNDGGDWTYKQRIDGTNASFPIPNTYTINGVVQGSAPNKLSIEVYLKGNPITRDFSSLLVYEDGPHTV
jgi:hypothetical protein